MIRVFPAATLLAMALLACGGQTRTDDGTGGEQGSLGGGGAESAAGSVGGGAAGGRNQSDTDWAGLIQDDSEVFCQKDIACGRAASVDDCPPAWNFRCTQSPAAIRQCLDEVRQIDCSGYLQASAGSCLPLRKSLDGC
jgi:hypothetical protein